MLVVASGLFLVGAFLPLLLGRYPTAAELGDTGAAPALAPGATPA
jgi:hypothetical protein